MLVYFVLAAQYESWILPLSVILAVPLALLGVVGALMFLHEGIASKNAILIVQYARMQRAAGRDIHDAAVEAARLRFRPIIMTSFAFILGVFPLVIATGAGAASERSIGIAVFAGMIRVHSLLLRGAAALRGAKAAPPRGAERRAAASSA